MMTTAILDTSFLFSLMNPHDRHHTICHEVARTFTGRPVIPVAVLPEVAYLLDSRLGHHVMRRFLRQLQQPVWDVEPLYSEDLRRCTELLEVYGDNRLDFVDATIVATAERLQVQTVLTLDRRHFQVVRPRHITHFQLLPNEF